MELAVILLKSLNVLKYRIVIHKDKHSHFFGVVTREVYEKWKEENNV